MKRYIQNDYVSTYIRIFFLQWDKLSGLIIPLLEIGISPDSVAKLFTY